MGTGLPMVGRASCPATGSQGRKQIYRLPPVPSSCLVGGVSAPVPSSDPVLPAPSRRWLSLWEWRLLAVMLALFAVRNLPWRLDEFDQAKQAFTSLEMVEGGQWWFQHTPGGRGVATKPPLIGWISAAFYGVTGGHWELAWRLPSFLAAVALAALLWQTGERLWPGNGGALAAAAFGFNLLTPRLATLVRTDMPLALWITPVGLIVWHHVRDGGRPWTPRARWAVCGLLLASLGTKGPIAYAFLLPGMAVLSGIVHRRGGSVSQVWGGWWHWTLPLVPFVFWLERGMVTMPGFSDIVIRREFLGRFTVGEKAVHHNQPFYFYFAQLLARWAPWSVLLLAVRVRAARVWWSLCRETGTLWLVCWAAGGLLCMTLVPSKRTDRIFPVVPPLCLVLTALLSAARRPPGTDPASRDLPWPEAWARLTTGAAVALAAGATVVGIVQVYRTGENVPSEFGARVLAATAGKRLEMTVGPQAVVGEEAMVVYLRRTRYLTAGTAAQMANAGTLDAVVTHDQCLAFTRGLLEPFDPARPELAGASFVLLAKPAPTPPVTPARSHRRN